MIVRGKDRTCSMLEPVHLAANKIGLNEVEIGLSDGRRPPKPPRYPLRHHPSLVSPSSPVGLTSIRVPFRTRDPWAGGRLAEQSRAWRSSARRLQTELIIYESPFFGCQAQTSCCIRQNWHSRKYIGATDVGAYLRPKLDIARGRLCATRRRTALQQITLRSSASWPVRRISA